MTLRERVKAYCDKKNIAISRFEKNSGLSNGYFNQVTKRPSIEKLDNISSTFPDLNIDWLLTGEGEMLKATAPIPLRKNKVIRFWENIEATGGGIMTFDDTVDGNYSEMVLPDFTDCTDAIRLVGDSMYPRYKSGQILVFKEWCESFVEFGQVYLIITRTGYRMVKYLQPSTESGKLICVSENKEQFPPFSIEIESIYRLYLIKGSVEQNTY